MRILITDGMDKRGIAMLRDAGHEVCEKFYESDALGAALREFDCVVVRSKTKVRAPHIDEAAGGRLKLIIRGGVGVDNIDVRYAEERGITVRNTPSASSVSVAEMAMSHMFALARFIPISNVTMRNGEWNKKQYKGTEIGGKTLGLVGFGRIARALAVRAAALGMHIVYTRRHSGKCDDYPLFDYMPLDELLKVSDYVSLHVPSPEDGVPLLGEREFALMKPTAYLINTARGDVIDEDALLRALDAGVIAGAGLDVFTEEPTKNEALVRHPRVSVTPHIGGQTAEAQSRIGEEIVSIITGFAG